MMSLEWDSIGVRVHLGLFECMGRGEGEGGCRAGERQVRGSLDAESKVRKQSWLFF